jgi:hypothetical protein
MTTAEDYQKLVKTLETEAEIASQKVKQMEESIVAAKAASQRALDLMRLPIICIGCSTLDIENDRNRKACQAEQYVWQLERTTEELARKAKKKTEKVADVYTSLQVLTDAEASPKRKALAKAYLDAESSILEKIEKSIEATKVYEETSAAYKLVDKPGVFADVLFPAREACSNAMRAEMAARTAVQNAEEAAIKACYLQILGTPDADPNRKAAARAYLQGKVDAVKYSIRSYQERKKETCRDINRQKDPGNVKWRDEFLKMVQGWREYVIKLETYIKELTEKASMLEAEIENTVSVEGVNAGAGGP